MTANPVLAAPGEFHLRLPGPILTEVAFSISVDFPDGAASQGGASVQGWELWVEGKRVPWKPAGVGGLESEEIVIDKPGWVEVELFLDGGPVSRSSARVLPAWIAVVPPLVAIVLALALRSVIPSLFVGIWIGAWALEGLGWNGLFRALLATFEKHVRNALIDGEHAAVILFTMMIGGMIGIVSRSGGIQAMAAAVGAIAKSRRGGQLLTVAAGFVVFFDDYANTLLVGKTMQPLTDRLRISRAKLAYIVDSTASPLACLAFVTTWIGFEVGVVSSSLPEAAAGVSAYSIFLSSLPYSAYPILALVLLFSIVVSGRDFGPMLRSESRALASKAATVEIRGSGSIGPGSEPTPLEGGPSWGRMISFIVPVLVLIVSQVAGLLMTGEGDSLREILGSSNPFEALLWASMLGALTAALMAILPRILTLQETLDG